LGEGEGVVRFFVPNFEACVEHYLKHHDITVLESSFIGEQKNEFDFLHLKALLESVEFSNVQRYEWCDFLPEGFDDYSRAYLPHMDFENGKLMVLNVTAEKIGLPTGGIENLTLGITHKR
jgi:hypothetical protein